MGVTILAGEEFKKLVDWPATIANLMHTIANQWNIPPICQTILLHDEVIAGSRGLLSLPPSTVATLTLIFDFENWTRTLI